VQASRPTVILLQAAVIPCSASSLGSDMAELESIRAKLGNGDAEEQLVTIAGHYGLNPGM
jgi:hypothetical protein